MPGKFSKTSFFSVVMGFWMTLGTSSAMAQDQGGGGSFDLVQNGDGSIPSGQFLTIAHQRFPQYFHDHTGRMLETVIRANSQYTTFLAIAERGGVLPLLKGITQDTAYTEVTFIKGDLGGASQISSDQIQIPEMPGADPTQLKSQVMGSMTDLLNDAAKAALAQEGQMTVFAPVNAAFAKLPAAKLATLQHDSAAAARFVRAYIVNRGVYDQGLSFITTMHSLAGTELTVGKASTGTPTISGVPIVGSEVIGDNGAVHGLAALLPPSSKTVSRDTPADSASH